jgi:hypothetical protein
VTPPPPCSAAPILPHALATPVRGEVALSEGGSLECAAVSRSKTGIMPEKEQHACMMKGFSGLPTCFAKTAVVRFKALLGRMKTVEGLGGWTTGGSWQVPRGRLRTAQNDPSER